MKNSSKVMSLAILLILMASCTSTSPTATESATPESTSTPTPIPDIPFQSARLLAFHLPGSTLYYPENAKVEVAEPIPAALEEYRIVGPEVSIRPGDADWVYNGPAYELTVRIFENPNELDSKTWAQEYLVSEWERALEIGAPMTMPVDEAGTIKDEYVESTFVSGYPAYRIEWFGGDSAIMEYFIAHGSIVLSLRFWEYPTPNQPLAQLQLDIYSLILGTLRLENE